MDTLKRVAVASERPVHPRVGEGFARDKFRVSGTKEMVEGAAAAEPGALRQVAAAAEQAAISQAR